MMQSGSHKPDLLSWNLLLEMFFRTGQYAKAHEHYLKMRKAGLQGNFITFYFMLETYKHLGQAVRFLPLSIFRLSSSP